MRDNKAEQLEQLDQPKEPESFPRWEEAKGKIQETLEDIRLVDHLRDDLRADLATRQAIIAILGAGPAVEIEAITDYFIAHHFKKPHIIAIDNQQASRYLTEEYISHEKADYEYTVADVFDYRTYGNEQYDLVIARKPDYHNFPAGWSLTMLNARNYLRPGGVILATAAEDSNYQRTVRDLSKIGNIVEHTIPPNRRADIYFPETNLILARKP